VSVGGGKFLHGPVLFLDFALERDVFSKILKKSSFACDVRGFDEV
jgi:hypothetical protein